MNSSVATEVLIEARGLGKAYPLDSRPQHRLRELFGGRPGGETFWALRDINLAVARGETVGIVGRNGSGKSTLLQMLCGLVQPSAGTVVARGRIAALLELGAWFNPDFTGRENVWLGASLLGLDKGEISRRSAAIEAFADIGIFMDQPLRQLSTGMQVRLAFAICAHVDADILLVDEVLAVGDALYQQKCMRFMREFPRRGALLLASHDIAAVTSLCERVLWLDGGHLRAEGPPEQVCRQYDFTASPEANLGQSGFQLGGRAWGANGDGRVSEPTQDSSQAVAQGGASILSASFLSSGVATVVAEGGEEVDLRICCEATHELRQPVVAFLLRDRLGQALFGDDTRALAVPRPIPAGVGFSALFRFALPHLPTGEYVLEASVCEGAATDLTLLEQNPAASVLTVHSHHPSAGCVNLPPVAAFLHAGSARDRGLLGSGGDA